MTDPSDPVPTKLHRPAPPHDLVPRPALTGLLDAVLGLPLALVSAPAGYGKTTLVNSWLVEADLPHLWLSLDAGDDDLGTFALFLAGALRTRNPKAGRTLASFLRNLVTPTPPAVARAFLREFAETEQDLVVVLEDYHLVANPVVHDFVDQLLLHPAPRVHFVVVTRHDPPLSLASLRARGQLLEIRARDLQFRLEEVRQFLTAATPVTIREEDVERISRRAEGWIAGLRLISLSLRDDESVAHLLAELDVGSRVLQDYLAGEVIARLPPETRRVLLRSSLLERFCAPLLDALRPEDTLADGPTGEEFLAQAQTENLFLMPLDLQGDWFRYHSLFRDLLRGQQERFTSPDETEECRRNAAIWLEEAGHLEEAIGQLRALGDTDSPVRLLKLHRHELMAGEHWPRLERWMAELPHEVVRADRELLVQSAWLAENRFRYAEMLSLIDEIGKHPGPGPENDIVAVEAELFFATRDYVAGLGHEAAVRLERALAHVPRRYPSQRGFAVALYAMACQMAGDVERGLSAALDGLSDRSLRGTSYHMRVLISLAHVHWMEANSAELRRSARELLTRSQKSDLLESEAFARYFLGVAAYESDRLDDAEEALLPLVEQRSHANLQNWAQAAFLLALSRAAQGDPAAAREIADRVSELALETQNPDLVRMAGGFQAELDLRQNRPEPAARWADSFRATAHPPRWRFYLPELTLARVRSSQGSKAAAEEARARLDDLYEGAVSTHGRRALVDVLALRALVRDQAGDDDGAAEDLEGALRRARPGGLVRPFLDLGPEMARLLSRFARENISLPFVGRLLETFRRGEAAAGTARSGHGGAPLALELEPLSVREAQVLGLLAERLAQREIADRLFISPGTVKKHLSNIYAKLNVHGRAEAIAKARALGLIKAGRVTRA